MMIFWVYLNLPEGKHLMVFASGLFPNPSIHYPTFRNDLPAGGHAKICWFEAVVELWKDISISQSIQFHIRIPESILQVGVSL